MLNGLTSNFDPRRRLRLASYEIPSEITLVDKVLLWRPGRWRKVRPLQKTVEGFLALPEASDSEILKYARAWGLLQLWLQSQGEPVDEWRRLSRIALAVLNLSQKLDEDELGSEADWDLLLSLKNDTWLGFRWKVEPNKKYDKQVRKGLVAYIINRWLEIGDVRPTLTWDHATKTDISLQLAGNGLLGALALGLLENAGQFVVAACSGCRKFYNPEIRPKSGQDRYCPTCRYAGVPVARAKRRKSLGLSKPRKR
jgi:hypothetical protein